MREQRHWRMVLAELQRQAELPESFGPPRASSSSDVGSTVECFVLSVPSSETVAGLWVGVTAGSNSHRLAFSSLTVLLFPPCSRGSNKYKEPLAANQRRWANPAPRGACLARTG